MGFRGPKQSGVYLPAESNTTNFLKKNKYLQPHHSSFIMERKIG